MATSSLSLLNGSPSTSVDATDRGFQYGDGVFTTLRVRNGVPLFAKEHLARLERDAALLKLPEPDITLLRSEMAQLVHGCASGVLKIQWTRGIGGRGYLPSAHPDATRFLILRPIEPSGEQLPDPVRVRLATLRLGINPAIAGAKHMNRLEQVLARMEWSDPQIDESLLLDSEGMVVEGTSTNLFLIQDGKLKTPRLDRAGVRGVMRDLLISWAKLHGVSVEKSRISLEDLTCSDALLLTNSLRGMTPVAQFEGHSYAGSALIAMIHGWYQKAVDQTVGEWA